METVQFTRMADGTKEEYEFLERQEKEFIDGTADRVLAALRLLDGSMGGYKISRLGHSLQSATMAHRAGADIDMVVTALLHDIGDWLAPCNHDGLAAAVLKPFVREECTWILEHHGAFQKIYYGHHIGADPNEREQYRGHPYFDACAQFCEDWDQTAFDPDYDTEPLEFFEPMVREVFARKPYDPAVIQAMAPRAV